MAAITEKISDVTSTDSSDITDMEVDMDRYADADLAEHIMEAENEIQQDSKSFICPVCDVKFNLRNRLETHMLTHGKRLHNCNICLKPFLRKGSLRIHMKNKHSPDGRRFECEICHKTFTLLVVLKDHMKIHTGERPYPCPHCEKTFNQSGNLWTHLQLHTGEKPFKCSFCEKRFVRKCTMECHMKTHTGEKPFTCLVCEKEFIQNGNLRVHFRRYHPLDSVEAFEMLIKDLRENKKSDLFNNQQPLSRKCRLAIRKKAEADPDAKKKIRELEDIFVKMCRGEDPFENDSPDGTTAAPTPPKEISVSDNNVQSNNTFQSNTIPVTRSTPQQLQGQGRNPLDLLATCSLQAVPTLNKHGPVVTVTSGAVPNIHQSGSCIRQPTMIPFTVVQKPVGNTVTLRPVIPAQVCVANMPSGVQGSKHVSVPVTGVRNIVPEAITFTSVGQQNVAFVSSAVTGSGVQKITHITAAVPGTKPVYRSNASFVKTGMNAIPVFVGQSGTHVVGQVNVKNAGILNVGMSPMNSGTVVRPSSYCASMDTPVVLDLSPNRSNLRDRKQGSFSNNGQGLSQPSIATVTDKSCINEEVYDLNKFSQEYKINNPELVTECSACQKKEADLQEQKRLVLQLQDDSAEKDKKIFELVETLKESVAIRRGEIKNGRNPDIGNKPEQLKRKISHAAENNENRDKMETLTTLRENVIKLIRLIDSDAARELCKVDDSVDNKLKVILENLSDLE